MAARTILLISPREPSGVTWLINCFLELGIRTYRHSPGGMWRESGGLSSLSPHEEVLRKWLPALSRRDHFEFRDGIEARWTHEWPTPGYDPHQVVFFVRDPRDALLSRYKRESPGLTFLEFVRFPDVCTLLNKADHWCLFGRSWLRHGRLKVCRFEDYKADAERTLQEVLDHLGIPAPREDLGRAAEASTFEKAAEAEAAYRRRHPEDAEVVNRSGRVGEWRSLTDEAEAARFVESRCGRLMERFGYAHETREEVSVDFSRHVRLLGSFKQVKLDLGRSPAGGGQAVDALQETLALLGSLGADRLARARLRPDEAEQLRLGSAEFLDNAHAMVLEEFSKVLGAGGAAPAAGLPASDAGRGLAAQDRRPRRRGLFSAWRRGLAWLRRLFSS